jgi:hypothetical protein
VGNSASGGNCLKLLNGGTLNIYGGTFEATKKTSSADGGVIVVSSDSGNVVDNTVKEAATFNLYGGTIRGGKAIKDGGNVAVWHSTSVFNMYGGVIEDGVADELGGGVVTTGTVNLLGGTIRNNDVYCESGTVTIGNKLKLEELTIKSGKTVQISDKGLTAATPIKLNASVGVFATNVATDLSGCFQVADGFAVTYNAADKTLSLTGQAHKTHCLCNGADLGLAPHSCKNISDWQPLTADVLTDYIARLRADGRRVFAAALDESAEQLGSFAIQTGDCAVIGNEGHGLSSSVIEACGRTVYIPMTDRAESLNAAVASALLMWEFGRKG